MSLIEGDCTVREHGQNSIFGEIEPEFAVDLKQHVLRERVGDHVETVAEAPILRQLRHRKRTRN